ncbi:succinylglutamate desuccinylase/aspartoacylase family protein [bacterium]|nr:succinylglutamate desuccinylase/aspartoacylase family protein [bacterium]
MHLSAQTVTTSRSVIVSAAGYAAAGQYHLNLWAGQPSPLGRSSGGGLILSSGFRPGKSMPGGNGAIAIDSRFESGNLLSANRIGPLEYTIELNPYDYWGYWFHFRIVNARDSTVTFHLTNVEWNDLEWNYLSPAVSPDLRNWSQITEHRTDGNVFSFTHTFTSDTAYVCTHPPFTTAMLQEYLDDIGNHAKVTDRRVITCSVEGRPVEMITITDPAAPDAGKLGAWMISLQHASEYAGWYVLQGLIDWLLSDDQEAEAVTRHMIINVVPMMNPDGVYHGRFRTNTLDIDLNRQWDNADPETEPSVYAMTRLLEEWVDGGNDFSLFLDFHATRWGRTCYVYRFDDSLIPGFITQTYYDNQAAFLNRLGASCPIIDVSAPQGLFTEGGSVSSLLYVASRYQGQNSHFFNTTYEGINVPVDHGPYAGQPMTIELERQNGEGFGRAIYAHYIEPLVDDVGEETAPLSFRFFQNYPNPFNPSTTIEFELPAASHAVLAVYNTRGEMVETLLSGNLPAGRHRCLWEAGEHPCGVYIGVLDIGSVKQVKKFVLMK